MSQCKRDRDRYQGRDGAFPVKGTKKDAARHATVPQAASRDTFSLGATMASHQFVAVTNVHRLTCGGQDRKVKPSTTVGRGGTSGALHGEKGASSHPARKNNPQSLQESLSTHLQAGPVTAGGRRLGGDCAGFRPLLRPPLCTLRVFQATAFLSLDPPLGCRRLEPSALLDIRCVVGLVAGILVAARHCSRHGEHLAWIRERKRGVHRESGGRVPCTEAPTAEKQPPIVAAVSTTRS